MNLNFSFYLELYLCFLYGNHIIINFFHWFIYLLIINLFYPLPHVLWNLGLKSCLYQWIVGWVCLFSQMLSFPSFLVEFFRCVILLCLSLCFLSCRRKQAGVYTSYLLGPTGKRVKVCNWYFSHMVILFYFPYSSPISENR